MQSRVPLGPGKFQVVVLVEVKITSATLEQAIHFQVVPMFQNNSQKFALNHKM